MKKLHDTFDRATQIAQKYRQRFEKELESARLLAQDQQEGGEEAQLLAQQREQTDSRRLASLEVSIECMVSMRKMPGAQLLLCPSVADKAGTAAEQVGKCVLALAKASDSKDAAPWWDRITQRAVYLYGYRMTLGLAPYRVSHGGGGLGAGGGGRASGHASALQPRAIPS